MGSWEKVCLIFVVTIGVRDFKFPLMSLFLPSDFEFSYLSGNMWFAALSSIIHQYYSRVLLVCGRVQVPLSVYFKYIK